MSLRLTGRGEFPVESMALVREFLLGVRDDPRLEDAWRRFWPFARSIIHEVAAHQSRRLGIDLDEAEQDAWLTVLTRLRTHAYDPARGSLSGWIAKMAERAIQNSAKARRRRVRRESAVREEAMARGPIVESVSPEPNDTMHEWEGVADLLASLSEVDRTMIELRFLEGKSDQEIAESFGTSSRAVRLRRCRALKRLRDRTHAGSPRPDHSVQENAQGGSTT